MRISYDNLLKTATLTATNENANYPVGNVFHRWQRKTFKATTTSVITAILDDITAITSVIIDYHNLTSCSVAFYNYTDTLIDTWAPISHPLMCPYIPDCGVPIRVASPLLPLILA